MDILNYLPEFKQVEPQLLHGLTAGWMLAQRPVKFTGPSTYGVATVLKGSSYFIENGVLVGLDADGFMVNAEDRVVGTPMYVVFSEEHLTLLGARKYFASEVDGAETFVRAIGLVGGDEFVTDNYTLAGGVTLATAKYAIVVDGVLELRTVGTDCQFAVSASTLANGVSAAHVVFIGQPLEIQPE